MRNPAVEYNVAVFCRAFLCCTLAWKAKQRLVLRATVLSNVKLLTTAAMVDNLAEKVDECPPNHGR